MKYLNRSNRRYALVMLLLLATLLAGCRNETQNRIRRDIQDFTGQRMYITVYAWDGTPVHQGQVSGQITRSVSDVVNGAANELGTYVFWYDETNQYFQTDLPYLLSSGPQNAAQSP